MVQLNFITPQFAGQSYELLEGRTTVGRNPDCDLVLEHGSISSIHCEILVHGPEVLLRDRHSKNGTWVEKARIDGQGQLKHGQTVRFGSVEAVLSLPELAPRSSSTISAVHLHWQHLRQRVSSSTSSRKAILSPNRNSDCTRTSFAKPSQAQPERNLGREPKPPEAVAMEPASSYWVAITVIGSLLLALLLFFR